MEFEGLFKLGLDRDLPPLLEAPLGKSIGLGESGTKRVGSVGLGLPEWCWPENKIPAEDGTVAIVHAYHFMEHLTGEDAITLLAEVQRVLMVG